jgi:hypothetical protein
MDLEEGEDRLIVLQLRPIAVTVQDRTQDMDIFQLLLLIIRL